MDVSNRRITCTITTDRIDRMGEVVVPGGGDFKEYEKTRIVLWAHNHDDSQPKLSLGKNLWIKPTKNGRGFVAETEFEIKGPPAWKEFVQGLYELYQYECLKSWSIGFNELPGCGRPDVKELKGRPDLAECRYMYRYWEMLEYSAVPIGANPDALSMARSKGLYIPKFLAAVEEAAPPSPPALPPYRTLEEVQRATALRVLSSFDADQLVSQAVQDAIGKASGKV